jgi:hypothetical protein
LTGPVHQTGDSSGIWRDSWVGQRVRFHVCPDDNIQRIEFNVTFPMRYQKVVDLTLQIDDSIATHSITLEEPTTRVRLEVQRLLPKDVVSSVSITSSACWCPQELKGSADNRQLSFQLTGVAFKS